MIDENKISQSNKYEIFLNLECNARCIFCSIGHMFGKKKKVKNRQDIMKEIKVAKDNGIIAISFSGGEPTIRKDLVEFVRYSKDLGFKIIEIQSNGIMYSYEDYVDNLLEAGANRFMVSVHGSNEKTHDFLTRVNGSFRRTVKGIENLSDRNVDLRFSIVLNRYNYRELYDWTKKFMKYEGFSYHINYVTPIGFAKNSFKKLSPRISVVVPHAKKSANLLLDSGLGPWIHNIYPCNMPGYERMMSELMEKKTIISGPDFKSCIDDSKMDGRRKIDSCEKCKFSLLCTGPYKKYLDFYGDEEFNPIKGEKVRAINFQKYGKLR